MSRSISPVEDASGTIRLTVPKRVLSWWWSTSIDDPTAARGARERCRCASHFAQSSATSARSPASAGSSRLSPSSGMRARTPRAAVAPVAEVHHGVLAERIERELRGEHRAERVSVRVLVGDEQEAVVLAERVGDRLQVSSSSGTSSSIKLATSVPPARPTDRTRRSSCGVRFSRSSRAIRAWSTPCAASSPASVLVRAFARRRARSRRPWRG